MYPPSMALELARERQVHLRESARPVRAGATTRLGRLLRLRSQPPARPQVESQVRPVLASTRS